MMPNFCLSSTPAARLLTRRIARELSASVMASLPASAMALAPVRNLSRSSVLGGSSSVMMTVWPRAMRSRMLSSSASTAPAAIVPGWGGKGTIPAGGRCSAAGFGSGSTGRTAGLLVTGWRSRTAAAIAATCAGPVPQQPPTSRAPWRTRSRAILPKYSGAVW